MKKKRDLEPGIKYRGYGVLNEYGEFEFIPEETGKNQGKRKLIKKGIDFTVSRTTECVIIHITKKRENANNKIKFMNEYLETVNETLKIIRDYEI